MKKVIRILEKFLPIFIMVDILLFIIILLTKNIVPTTISEGESRLISALSTLITSTFLILTGILSYFKFFRGRIFSPKIYISTKSGIIKNNTDRIFWIEAQYENKGNVAIIDYDITFFTYFYIRDRLVRREVKRFIDPPVGSGRRIIEVGESAFETAYVTLPNEVSFAIFQAVLIDENRNVWWRSHTSAGES